jgi:cell division ATPase FtsA
LKDEFYISLIGEAFDGYTEASLGDDIVYIKHVNIRDQRYLHKYFEKYKDLALKRGLDTEAERIKYVLKEKLWEEKDDMKIASLEGEITNLKNTVNQLLLASQREEYNNIIRDRAEELYELKKSRSEVVGKTAEDYGTGRSSDELLRFLLFKDKDLTQNLYTEDEFSELEGWEIKQLTDLHLDIQSRLADDKIQKAVLRPFFSMYLSLCEDAYGFYQKPVTELTIYQLRVVLFGRMFFNIFQHTEDIPDNIRDDPEKLLAYSQSKSSGNTGGIRDDADSSVVFGATNQDVKELGGEKAVSLSEEAKKHGGQLDMTQMMRLAGHDV